MRSLILLLGLSFSLMLAGCSTPPEERLEAPVSKVESLSVTGTTGTLALRFAHPNNVPLVISSSTHTLTLGEKSIGTIEDETPIGLPPMGNMAHTVTLPAKLAQAAQAYLLKNPGEVRATVKSSLEAVITGDDTITLKSLGSGLVTAP